MKDWINDMVYNSWCRVKLKDYIEESVKGHVSIEIVNDDALVEIFSQDYSHKYYAQIVYDFGKRMENHDITDLELVSISEKVKNRYRSKILGKYFK